MLAASFYGQVVDCYLQKDVFDINSMIICSHFHHLHNPAHPCRDHQKL
jgi:hypothetical protein